MLCVGERMGVERLLRILPRLTPVPVYSLWVSNVELVSWSRVEKRLGLLEFAQVLLDHASTVLNLHPVHESPSYV